MQNRRNKLKKALAKALAFLMIIGTLVGVMPAQKAAAASKYYVQFGTMDGTATINESGQLSVSYQFSVYETLTQTITAGKKATRPTSNPTRAGYTFDDWYADYSYSALFDFNTAINAPQNVFARWIKANVQFVAYDESTGSAGGGKITVNGPFPGTSATQVGPSASFSQDLYDDGSYTFAATPNNGYYFKGWSLNDPSNELPNYSSFSPVWLSSCFGNGNLQTVYAVFGKMGSETATWRATENQTSKFSKSFGVKYPGQYPDGLYVLEDNNNITETHWKGLTSDGKLPNDEYAYFVITLKNNVPVGSYNVVLTDNVSQKVINATISVEHDLIEHLPVAATCNSTGNNRYWKCQECNKVFSDQDCTQETTEDAMKIPALGHDYGNWQYLNATQHRHYCSRNNGHFETRNHTWNEGTITTPPTTDAEGVKTYTCTGCGGTKTESVPKVVNTYTIKYHETENAAVSGSSEIVYGSSTPIKTVAELNYSTEGRKFLGWIACREKDQTWYVIDSNGKKFWSKTLPANGTYYLYKDGISVGKTTAAGETAHFYGQWQDATYTILYHENDNAAAGNITTSVPYGTSTRTLTPQDLNYNTTGKTFLGWRVVRESDGKTYVKNKDGKSYFGASIPSGGSLSLYAEGVEVAKTAPAGTVVHFYAQWATAENSYTIQYHETNEAAASASSQVVYGTSTPITTIADLGYSTNGREFLGWRVYREKDQTWYVMDIYGKKYWSKTVPANGSYCLYPDGVSVAKTTSNGYTVHFYGQWQEP